MRTSSRKNRLAWLITIAVSSGVISSAWALPNLDVAIRIENTTAELVAPVELCGMTPKGINGVAYEWSVRTEKAWYQVGGSYCFSIARVGPYQSVNQEITWKPEKLVAPSDEGEQYQDAEGMSPQLIALANSFASISSEGRVNKIHQWLVANVAYTGIKRSIEGAEYALQKHLGDCTEQMLLGADLLQINGYKVRRVLGVLLSNDDEKMRTTSLHNWVEYLDNGKWLVFDSSRKVFPAQENFSYIALWYYTDSRQLSLQPFSTRSPHIKLYLH